MDLTPPPQDNDPIISKFKPGDDDQWELNDENIKRVDWWTGETILINYCKYINTTPLAVYRYLIETKGCNVGLQDKYKHAALEAFCSTQGGGNIAALKYLLNQKGINGNIKDENGSTLPRADPAWYNIIALLIGAFNLLSQKMFNVNVTGGNQVTLLHTACVNINILPLEIFKLLIETHGCDVNLQANNNDTPLQNALSWFDPDHGGDITTLRYLLSQKDINVDVGDGFGCTLLHWACNNINSLPIDIFKVLIETHGADVNVQDNDQSTPIHLAIHNFNPHEGGDITVLTYLINQQNVDVSITNQNGHTLLHSACICVISDLDDADYDSTDSDDDSTDSDDDLDDDKEAKSDTISCQIVETIVERCIEEVSDETTTS
jgi:ankyrin repeat protein